jgi:hypothetical protein
MPESRQPTSPPAPASPRIITVKESRLTLADLLDDLLWPKLLRAPALGLQPSRIGIALFTLVLIGLIGGINAAFSDDPPFLETIASLTFPPAAVADYSESTLSSTLSRFGSIVSDHPMELILQGVPMLVVLAIGWGAIARMAASEFSAGVQTTWPEGLGFVTSRLASFVGAVLGAPALIGLLCLILALSGLMFMQVPVLDVLGAALFPIAIALALLATLLTLGLILGGHILVPAMACEGTDAIDALQRTYAYVVARPGRLVVYTLILLAVLAITALVLGSIATGVEFIARNATSAWMGDAAATAIEAPTSRQGAEPLAGTRAAASSVINFWIGLVWLIAGAATFSTFASGSTVLYLLLRQVCDGQDWGELWFPENAEAGRDELAPTPASSHGSSPRDMISGSPGPQP